MGSKPDDRPDGERNSGHLPEEVETTVQEEGGGRGHGACPQCALRLVCSYPPQQAPDCEQEDGGQRRPGEAEVSEYLQVLVVAVPVDIEAAAGGGPAQDGVPGPRPGQEAVFNDAQRGGGLAGARGWRDGPPVRGRSRTPWPPVPHRR